MNTDDIHEEPMTGTGWIRLTNDIGRAVQLLERGSFRTDRKGRRVWYMTDGDFRETIARRLLPWQIIGWLMIVSMIISAAAGIVIVVLGAHSIH